MSEQRITAIEVQEKRSNRRSIFVNGKFVLGVDAAVVADLGLRVGREIGEEDLKKLVRAELVNKAKEKALRLLEYRPRSRAELARRLAQDGFEPEIVEEVLARLEHLGYVDDVSFSEIWVRHRLSGKGMGRTRLKWELRRKGVAPEVVDEAISAVDPETEYELALAAARRRLEKDQSIEQQRKTAAYLRRQGYDWETIKRVIAELAGDQPDG
ncbi:MAG: regulatory protein RecX [Armatimonadota bacterium]